MDTAQRVPIVPDMEAILIIEPPLPDAIICFPACAMILGVKRSRAGGFRRCTYRLRGEEDAVEIDIYNLLTRKEWLSRIFIEAVSDYVPA